MLSPIHIITLICYISVILIVIFFKLKNHIYCYILILGCIIFIIFIGTINKIYYQNKNKECIIGNNKQLNGFYGAGCLDIWHIYHLLFWILLGIFVPNQIIICIFVSLSWELLEHIVFKSCKSCSDNICGRFEDPIINLIGYIIGSFIASRI